MLTKNIKIGEWYEAGIHGFVKVARIVYGKHPGERAVLKVTLPTGSQTCLFAYSLNGVVTGPPAATLAGKLRRAVADA